MVAEDKSDSKARVFGPGLEGGVANLPCVFLVELNGALFRLLAKLKFSNNFGILLVDVDLRKDAAMADGNGTAAPEVTLVDNEDGTVTGHFTPTEPGIYILKVRLAGEHMLGSPFVMQVQPANNNLKLSDMKISGVERKIAADKGSKMKFNIEIPTHATAARMVPQIKALDDSYAKADIVLSQKKPGLFECRFVLSKPGRYYFMPSLGGVAFPGSPFVVRSF
ncbi:unnamed protein product [Gongylonema pulchrum]|uniref:GOLD domain-containing protein n=1 Tax=Gongylonema pulchrum TaxID=637853 RepID=A0A183DP89_9BILA|nr:unnamed protein product [Gongylonema pulchrum]